MNFILNALIVSVLYTANAQQVLKSEKLRSTICIGVEKSYGEDQKDCESGSFVFAKPALTQTIAGEEIVVQMTVEVTFTGKTFKAVLNADLTVNANGKISRRGWILSEVIPTGITDAALLEESFTTSKNVELVSYTSLPRKVQQAIDAFEDSEREYFDDASDWEDGDRVYYAVKNSEDCIIGYLVTDSWMSETVDVKIFFTLRFDKDGSYLNSDAESFGYYE